MSSLPLTAEEVLARKAEQADLQRKQRLKQVLGSLYKLSLLCLQTLWLLNRQD